MDPGVDAEVSAQLLLFAEQTNDFVGVADGWGRVLYLNPAARKRLGVSDLSAVTIADVFPVDEFAFYYEVARPQLLRTGAWSGEVRVTVAGEGALPMYVSTTATIGPGGQINGLVVHAREVLRVDSARVADIDRDDATGLLTPAAFEDRVRDALASMHRSGEAHALVLVDIVTATDTIETVGQLTAATITRSLAGRLTRLSRAIDAAGRVGEYQLGLLLGAVRSRGEALRIARTVYEALVDPPITTAGGEVAAVVRCGVAMSQAGDDPVELMRRAAATIAGEPAGRDAGPSAVGGTGDRAGASATMDDFRLGFSHGDVRPFAQPVIDLGESLVVGYRGTVQWHHRRLGTLDASAFIEMISDTPLASQVDLYVARETAAVVALSVRDLPLSLYVPVSRRLIADVRTEQYLSEIADAFHLSMNQFRLQVARPLLDPWSPSLQGALESLREADVAVAVTGVERASDAHKLAGYPFDELHIPSRLTTAAVTDADARLALLEIMQFARDRALLVAATGVTTEQQHELLVEVGCDFASGDIYGPPEPAHNID